MSTPEQTAEIRSLVDQLSDPATRRAARQRLVTLGAVEALVGCLGSHNESIVWAAIQSLRDLKAKEALLPLAGLVERGVLAADAADALARITGQTFGLDHARWKQWLSSPADQQPSAGAAECVKSAGEYLGAEPKGGGKAFEFRLSQPSGRSQRVQVQFGRVDSDGDELVVVYTECGPADAKHYEQVLRKNLQLPAGAFAIRDVGGVPNLVIVETAAAASLTGRQLAKMVDAIGARADKVEQSLAKEDER